MATAIFGGKPARGYPICYLYESPGEANSGRCGGGGKDSSRMNDYPLESFVFYRSFRDAIEEMPDDEKLATLLGICDYALYGVEPKLKGVMSRAVFTVARPSIDANNCRRTNGKKGGRPPKKPMVSNSENQWFSKSESTETESGSETESESESGSGANGADKPPETHFGPELETDRKSVV